MVRVHVLPKQLDLRKPRIRDPPRLFEHTRCRPAPLLAPRIRHHAVRAELVTSLDDRDVPAMRIRPRHKLRLKRLVRLPVVKPGDPLLATPPAAPASPARFRYDADPDTIDTYGRLIEDLLALLLRHAPQHRELLPLALQPLVLIQPVKHLLLRLVTDRTRVVQDQTRLGLVLHPRIPLLLQRPDHLLGIVRVHLAAKGLDVKSLAHTLSIVPMTSRSSLPFAGDNAIFI